VVQKNNLFIKDMSNAHLAQQNNLQHVLVVEGKDKYMIA
jgi:hypothetical protein